MVCFQVFKNYLTFCGIGLTNAQLFEMSVQEYQRNQARYLLDLLNQNIIAVEKTKNCYIDSNIFLCQV